MRRFEMSFLMTAMIGMLVTACGSGHSSGEIEQRSFDRAAAVARIEARLEQDRAWKERYRPLAARKKEGEDVDAELDALKSSRPQFTDLKQDAVRIVDANPLDEAAFQAIGIAMRSQRGNDANTSESSTDRALQERLLNALLEHHLHRSDFLDAIHANFSTDADSVAFWTKVFDASPWPTVRATAAYRLTKGYSRWLDDQDLLPKQRQELREQARRYGLILRDEYADATPLASQAERLLAALDYSPGATLPGIDVATVAGGRDTLANYRGKVVLLDVWASWCGPCRKDHPKLIALKQELAGKPFEIISISADESPELVTQYMTRELSLPWPQWYVGPEGSLLKVWGVSGYPTYLLVDSEGVVQARGVTTYLDEIQNHARELVARTAADRSAASLAAAGS